MNYYIVITLLKNDGLSAVTVCTLKADFANEATKLAKERVMMQYSQATDLKHITLDYRELENIDEFIEEMSVNNAGG